jgi:hypothetical protein
MSDRKIFVNLTPMPFGQPPLVRVPIYWTGEENDGVKEYKNPCGCCCFGINLESQYANGSGSFRGAHVGFQNEASFYRSISGSYNASQSSSSKNCLGETSSYSYSGNGSDTFTLEEVTENYETKLQWPDDRRQVMVNYTECYQGYTTLPDGCTSGQQLYFQPVWNMGGVQSNTTRSSSFSDTNNDTGDCGDETESFYNFSTSSSVSSTLTDQLNPELALGWARSNFSNNNQNEMESNDVILNAFGYVPSITDQRFGPPYFSYSGSKRYRIKYTDSPTGYLKVWLRRYLLGVRQHSNTEERFETTSSISMVLNSSLGGGQESFCDQGGVYNYSENFSTDTVFDLPLMQDQWTLISYYVGISIEKYSFLADYEPDISDPSNKQQSGFPDPNWTTDE